METREIRLANLLALAANYRRLADFCERIGVSPSYFSQVKSGRKALGDVMVRKIEEKLGLHRGYMDTIREGAEETKRPPASDALAVAYAIESLPAPLREQFTKLVHQVAVYCTTEASTEEAQAVGAFNVRINLNEEEQNHPHLGSQNQAASR